MNARILPATQTVGSLNPHILQIELPTFSEADVRGSLEGTRDVKPAQILAHELCHWFDIVGTVWGQNYLTALFSALDDAVSSELENTAYPSALAMFDADRHILFPSYYKYVAKGAVGARGPGTWQLQLTTGVKIGFQGHGDEDSPIFFVRLATDSGEVARQPLTIGALLELRALRSETLIFQAARRNQDLAEQIVGDSLYNKELVALLYDPELTTYSAAAHLLGFAIGNKDILAVFILGDHIADLTLNLTPETFARLRIPSEIAACGMRRTNAFIVNQDRGYAFAAISFWLRDVVIEQVRSESFQEGLRRAGLQNSTPSMRQPTNISEHLTLLVSETHG